MPITITRASDGDADELAVVAAVTFPLACPPSADPADIDAAVAASLSRERFAQYLADPERVILVATESGRIVGYAMLVCGTSDDPSIARTVRALPAVELSKIYVLPASHGSGASAALMRAGICWAIERGAASVWLGVNQNNERAQRFYRKHGFEITGTRRFQLGRSFEDDFVMVRPLSAPGD